ncbi:DMT(drug/metabolite transporter) superfamily permease [Desulfocurvibacter africanus PCS]|uniref:DMT(Drug/metabolite transporter) superfamily permease n=1 Tax=Desulfocurvibacter africanus PCS TaxID=1262666 RepID=M5Q147_DESAF|nr:DMT family transporter [Desulfocurvibacter africanus]EMG36238.1 DMT(drug/metabolite transporter) superfamily permease [Desulfocurvibacter africanus PCS]
MPAVYVKLVASMAIWGGTWVSGRIVAGAMEPFSAAFLRFLVASIFLVFMTMREEKRLPILRREHMLHALLLGLTGVFAYNAFFFSGLRNVPAGKAALIIASTPAVMAIFSGLFLKERLGRWHAVGIPLSLSGVLLIISRGDPLALLEGGLGRGELYIFGCVAAWSAYSLLGKRAMVIMSPLTAVTWSCIFGCILLLPAALAEGLAGTVRSIDPVVWGNLLFLGVMATGLSFAWYYEGIKAIGASRAGVFINLVPVAAIGLGVLVLGESVTWTLAAGGAMVICGVWLTNRRPQPARAPADNTA